ncbi:hypothetical protein R3P96_19350 [Rhodococcus yunnanensis]|uniref:Uncharacterized protein n=1 Tax=Rhodococcoides yunnanense TaxID=278209 RepID=A0ABU4BHE7_9NOCA|nr:hypothetical protein [Rhodococcus yunnanensis]MDV6263499.1 hypothetical protein [Rhodococcus yunnanensis]
MNSPNWSFPFRYARSWSDENTPRKYQEPGSGFLQEQIIQSVEIGLSPTNVDVLLPTSNPAALTALSGMVHGSHGSAVIGAAAVEGGESTTGAPDVEPPHPATRTIAPTTPATHHRVALTFGWTRRTAARFHDDLTH